MSVKGFLIFKVVRKMQTKNKASKVLCYAYLNFQTLIFKMAATISQKLINRLRPIFYGTLRTSIVPAPTRIIVIYVIDFFQVEILKGVFLKFELF